MEDPNASPLREQVVSRVLAHFDAMGTGETIVPEWGEPGSPLVIYHTPITVLELQKVYDGYAQRDPAVFVDIVILKAKDGQGKPLFTKADKPKLLTKGDPEVFQRLAMAIMTYGTGGTSGNGLGG